MIFVCPICGDSVSVYSLDEPPACCFPMTPLESGEAPLEPIDMTFGPVLTTDEDEEDLDDIVRRDRIAAREYRKGKTTVLTTNFPPSWRPGYRRTP